MPDLHLIGVAEDGAFLLLGREGGEGEFRLPIDDALRSAVRWEQSRGAPRRRADEQLRPRDVQAMIRAGATAQEAAERANWPVEKVHRYEGPILAEREHVAFLAGRAHLRTRGAYPVTLSERVAARLHERGVDPEDEVWDSWRAEDGQWTVELHFAAGGRRRAASWHFSRNSMTVTAVDDEARWLSDEESPAPDRPVPSRPVAPPPDIDSSTAVERDGRAGREQPGRGEVDLMSSLREHSSATKRRRGRGPRRATAPTTRRPDPPAAVSPAARPDPRQPEPTGSARAEPSPTQPEPARSGTRASPQAGESDAPGRRGGPDASGHGAQGDAPEEPDGPRVEDLGSPTPDASAPPSPRRKRGRSSVPAWDDVMFGAKHPRE